MPNISTTLNETFITSLQNYIIINNTGYNCCNTFMVSKGYSNNLQATPEAYNAMIKHTIPAVNSIKLFLLSVENFISIRK